MEIYYKSYQKIKIYLDKIQCALPNLNRLKELSECQEFNSMIAARYNELIGIQIQLVDFCLSIKNTEPYVPHSGCKAITSWYNSKAMKNALNLTIFENYLLKANK